MSISVIRNKLFDLRGSQGESFAFDWTRVCPDSDLTIGNSFHRALLYKKTTLGPRLTSLRNWNHLPTFTPPASHPLLCWNRFAPLVKRLSAAHSFWPRAGPRVVEAVDSRPRFYPSAFLYFSLNWCEPRAHEVPVVYSPVYYLFSFPLSVRRVFCSLGRCWAACQLIQLAYGLVPGKHKLNRLKVVFNECSDQPMDSE